VGGYERGDDAGGGPHHEGAAEDAQEHAHGLEERCGVEHVGVGSAGLVRHDGPEPTRASEHSSSCGLIHVPMKLKSIKYKLNI